MSSTGSFPAEKFSAQNSLSKAPPQYYDPASNYAPSPISHFNDIVLPYKDTQPPFARKQEPSFVPKEEGKVLAEGSLTPTGPLHPGSPLHVKPRNTDGAFGEIESGSHFFNAIGQPGIESGNACVTESSLGISSLGDQKTCEDLLSKVHLPPFHSVVVPCGIEDSEALAITANPLAKSDRYTVVKGRLSDSDPFMCAVQNLGVVFLSNRMKIDVGDLRSQQLSEEDRKAYFMKDIEAFNIELSRKFKVPYIGGGHLNLYGLAIEVMKLGGLKNVVQNRAFRIVGQRLELPKSCTNAAYVMKNAYEKLVYMYEQKLTFGVDPVNPLRTIDMKSVVSEKKKTEERRRDNARLLFRPSGSWLPPTSFPPLTELQGRILKRTALASNRRNH